MRKILAMIKQTIQEIKGGRNNMYYSRPNLLIPVLEYIQVMLCTVFLQNPNNSNFTGGTYSGTWFQWEFFEKVKVSKLRIAGNPLSGNSDRSPEK